MRHPLPLSLCALLSAAVLFAGAGAAIEAQQPATNLGSDANGNPLRRALKTGHVSNYDEAKVPPYTLPDPLVFADGTPVRTARDWTMKRRAEVLRMYESEIFGRIPAVTPKVAWRVTEDHGPEEARRRHDWQRRGSAAHQPDAVPARRTRADRCR